jgi:hypothetical protein
MANLFQILIKLLHFFVKNVSFKQALLRVKMNTRILDTPCIIIIL